MKRYLCIILILLLCLSGCDQKKEERSSIPIISIRLEEGKNGFDQINQSEDHSYGCKGSLNIAMPDGTVIQDLKLEYMRGRGNSTWLADKKPYKIKFDEKQDLFSLGENKHWVLLANAYDRTFLKNRLTFYLAEKLGMEYVPQGVNVELYVNGEYLGNYLLCGHVRIDRNRIDIDKLKNETEAPEIWGGYLLSFSPWEEQEEENIFRTSRNVPFYNDTPGFLMDSDEHGTIEQRDYIRDYIQCCEDAIFAEDDSYKELIDEVSAADYWLIQEFCQNADAFVTPSSYAYKKRFTDDGEEGKLYFGPLWDFDRAWGDTGFFSADPAYFNHVTHPWVDELRDKEDFARLLKERWKLLDEVLEEALSDGGLFDQWVEENKNSSSSDSTKWVAFYQQSDYEGTDDYVMRCHALKEWINARRKWIRENLDDIGKILARVTIRSDICEDKTLKLKLSSFLFETLEAEEKEGYVFEGWFDESGNRLEENAIVRGDMVIYARYKKQ